MLLQLECAIRVGIMLDPKHLGVCVDIRVGIMLTFVLASCWIMMNDCGRVVNRPIELDYWFPPRCAGTHTENKARLSKDKAHI